MVLGEAINRGRIRRALAAVAVPIAVAASAAAAAGMWEPAVPGAIVAWGAVDLAAEAAEAASVAAAEADAGDNQKFQTEENQMNLNIPTSKQLLPLSLSWLAA